MTVQAIQESVVKIQPNQEVTSTDFMELQEGPQSSVDAIVAEALGTVDKYVGMTVTEATDTSLAVAVGRLWTNGPRYRLAAPVTLDVLPFLPTLGLTRIVSVVVSGVLLDTEIGYRRYVVDPTVSPPITEPRTVATRTRREVAATLVSGVMGTAPVPPSIPAGAVEIARVTLSESGIISIEMMTINQLVSLSQTQALLDLLQDQLESFAGQLASLRSDFLALSAAMANKVDKIDFRYLTMAVARLNERLDIPDVRIGAGIDNFESESESDILHGSYDAFVDWGGVHFPRETSSLINMALLNPVDPALQITAGDISIPKYDSTVRLQASGPYSGTIRPSDSPSGTWQFFRHVSSRVFVYYGAAQTKKQFEAELSLHKSVKLFDPVLNVFETVDMSNMEWNFKVKEGGKGYVKIKSSAPHPYWTIKQIGHNYTGSGIAQTWLNSRHGHLTSIDFYLTTKGGAGSIHVVLCRVKDDGTPDINRSKRHVTVNQNNLVTGWNSVSIPATIVEQDRFAIVFVTTGIHVFGTTASDDTPVYERSLHGSAFQDSSGPGTTWSLKPGIDIALRLQFADFHESQVTVALEALSLTGGISQIDWHSQGHEPEGTDLVLRAQIGGVWRNLDEYDLTALNALPNLIPMQLVFMGTPSLMPYIHLDNSRIIAWRPKAQFTHVSTVRTPSSATSNVTVTFIARDFTAANHTLVIALLTGAGFTTVVAANSTTVYDTIDDRYKRIVAKFTPAAITAYKIRAIGATSAPGNVFALMYRVDFAI